MPAVPVALVALVITGVLAAAAIVIEMPALLVCPPDVTETVPTTVPGVVGVPVIKPEEALMTKPDGRPDAPYCTGGVALDETW